MSTTIGQSISRIRNTVKGVREDAFLTDRTIWNLIMKYAKMLIRRQDNEGKIAMYRSIFETIPCLDLIEVDKVEACCTGIKTGCTIMRTKDPIPDLLEGSTGPIFRNVSSLDGSRRLVETDPKTYTSIANSKSYRYNTTKYFWYRDGYLYFPNIEWEGVLVEALWLDNVEHLKCNTPSEDSCKLRQDDALRIPDYLFAELEQMVLKDLSVMLQIPGDRGDDKQNVLRS